MLIMKIRPATVDDVEAIAAVIEPFVDYVHLETGRIWHTCSDPLP